MSKNTEEIDLFNGRKQDSTLSWWLSPLGPREVIMICLLLVLAVLCMYTTYQAQTCAVNTYNNVADYYKTHCVCNMGPDGQLGQAFDPAMLEAMSHMH